MRATILSRRVLTAGLAGIATLALAAACGGDDSGSMPDMGHGGTGPAASSPPASQSSFNDADVAFAQNMIPHHEQAVQMADLAASRATDADVKQLAEQIKAAQEPEIRTMTGWLTAWGMPTSHPSGHAGMSMPGMMSEADMSKLTAATGADFDRVFVQMMIAHHNGAIQMARDEQANGANAEAKALAAVIERDQTAEVGKLQQILDRL